MKLMEVCGIRNKSTEREKTQQAEQDFEGYKQQLNAQTLRFMEKLLVDTQFLQNELENRSSEFDNCRKYYHKCQVIMKQNVEKILQFTFTNYNKLLLRSAIEKWRGEQSSQKAGLCEFITQLRKQKLEIQQSQDNNKFMKELIQFSDKINNLQKQICNLKQQNRQLSTRKEMLEQCLSQVSKLLQIKVAPNEIDTKHILMDNQRIKTSIKLIEQLDFQNQLYNYQQKQLSMQSKYVQTNISSVVDQDIIDMPIQAETSRNNNRQKATFFSRIRTPKRSPENFDLYSFSKQLQFDKELLQQQILTPKSNLIDQQLPKLKQKPQLREELKKQLNQLNSSSIYPDTDIKRKHKIEQNIKKRPKIVVSYYEYPSTLINF